MRTTLLRHLLPLFLILHASLASGMETTLEVHIGGAFPIAPFPDGRRLPLADPQGQHLLKKPQSIYNLLLDIEPSSGLNLGLTLWLNNFSLKSSWQYYPNVSVGVRDFSVTQLAGTKLSKDAQQVTLNHLLNRSFDKPLEDIENSLHQHVDFVQPSDWWIGKLLLGYRFRLPPFHIQPYLPLSFGLALFKEIQGIHFGPSFQTGLGCEYRLTEKVEIGVALIYEWAGIFLDEQFDLTQTSKSSTGGSEESDKNKDNNVSMESLHSFQLSVVIGYIF